MGMEGVYIYLLIIDRDHHQLASEEKSRRRWNLRDFIDGWIVIIYISYQVAVDGEEPIQIVDCVERRRRRQTQPTDCLIWDGRSMHEAAIN